MAELTERIKPNILITGTPGTGKTLHSSLLCESLPGVKVFNVSQIVQENKFDCGFDAERNCLIIDEDKLCDFLEAKLQEGNCIVDTHSLIDYFPERWFDLVVCLTTQNHVLYDRLVARGYSDEKVKENVQCEIMQVISTEALSSYPEEIVQLLKSENNDDLENNVERIKIWYKNFCSKNKPK